MEVDQLTSWDADKRFKVADILGRRILDRSGSACCMFESSCLVKTKRTFNFFLVTFHWTFLLDRLLDSEWKGTCSIFSSISSSLASLVILATKAPEGMSTPGAGAAPPTCWNHNKNMSWLDIKVSLSKSVDMSIAHQTSMQIPCKYLDVICSTKHLIFP